MVHCLAGLRVVATATPLPRLRPTFGDARRRCDHAQHHACTVTAMRRPCQVKVPFAPIRAGLGLVRV